MKNENNYEVNENKKIKKINKNKKIKKINKNKKIKKINKNKKIKKINKNKKIKKINKNKKIKKINFEKKIINILKTIYDPEIPVDIYELGLIYDVKIDIKNNVDIVMTLTSPNCPVAEILIEEVKNKIEEIDLINNVKIHLTFNPIWTTEMMSEKAKFDLGMI